MEDTNRVSGKKLLLIMAIMGAVMWTSLFLFSLKQKRLARERRENFERSMKDSLTVQERANARALSLFLGADSTQWIALTKEADSSLVVISNCDDSLPLLQIRADSNQIVVKGSTGVGQLAEQAVSMNNQGPGEIRLDWKENGMLLLETVTAALAEQFPTATLQGTLLLWINPQKDTTLFVPDSQAEIYEVFRKMDQMPNPCLDSLSSKK